MVGVASANGSRPWVRASSGDVVASSSAAQGLRASTRATKRRVRGHDPASRPIRCSACRVRRTSTINARCSRSPSGDELAPLVLADRSSSLSGDIG